MIFIFTIERAAAIRAGYDLHGKVAEEVPLSQLAIELLSPLAALGDRFDEDAYEYLKKKPKPIARMPGFSIDKFLRAADIKREDHQVISETAKLDAASVGKVLDYAFGIVDERRAAAAAKTKEAVDELAGLLKSATATEWLDYFNDLKGVGIGVERNFNAVRLPQDLVQLAQESLPAEALERVNNTVLEIARETRSAISEAMKEHARLRFLHSDESGSGIERLIRDSLDSNDAVARFKSPPASPARLFEYLLRHLEKRTSYFDRLGGGDDSFDARDCLETLLSASGTTLDGLYGLLAPEFDSRLREAEQLAAPALERIAMEIATAIDGQRRLERAARPFFERWQVLWPGSEALKSLEQGRLGPKDIEDTVRAVMMEPIKQFSSLKAIEDSEMQGIEGVRRYSEIAYSKETIAPFTEEQAETLARVDGLLREDKAVVKLMRHRATTPGLGVARPIEMSRLAISVEIQALDRTFSRQLAYPLKEKAV